MTKLELACFNAKSAVIAAKEGVDRIELCENYAQGGLTPKTATLKKLKKEFELPVFVMIRPRGGGFIYTDEEFKQMKTDLIKFKEAGADGFVFGVLTEDKTINMIKNAELIKLAAGRPCTFHRAFDEITDKEAALEEAISCGFQTILTSGGKQLTALQGLSTLLSLKEKAQERITLLVGGGVRSGNVTELKKHFDFLHSACITPDTENIDVEELNAIQEILTNPV